MLMRNILATPKEKARSEWKYTQIVHGKMVLQV